MRFIGEYLGRAKGFKCFYFYFILISLFFWLQGFIGYKEWIIQLD
jgi:hypothetical protein